MGLISGDNIGTITVGKDIVTNARVTAYDAPEGNELDSIPAGTDLGICNNADDRTNVYKAIFFRDNFWWMSFPAPDAPLGDQGNVTQAFWIKYDAATINVNGAPPSDNSGLNGLPQGLQNLFGSIENMIIVLAVILLIVVGIFIYLNFFHKK
jgi:hypothetical protein